MDETLQPTRQQNFAVRKISLIVLGLTFVLIALVVLYLVQNTKPPANFPLGTMITVAPGTSAAEIARSLKEKNVVSSELILYAVLLAYYDPTELKASDYIFYEPLDVFGVAKRLTEGDFDSSLINFTHREGERINEIAENASAVLENFDSAAFIQTALPYEGKLFPDKYRIPPNFTADKLFTLMTGRYEDALSPLRERIASHRLAEDEIIILASILEREANSLESMKMVSGILQNRLRIMMPLQVDASIEYILDKPLGKLTPGDLTIDSPYNTYQNFGLPPTPIGNPGLIAIMAVLEPTPSEYLFYITGDDGEFYYAETFDEHKINIVRHLR